MSFYLPSVNYPHFSLINPIISSNMQPPFVSLSLSYSSFSMPSGASCLYCGSFFSGNVFLFLLTLQPHCTHCHQNLHKSHFTHLPSLSFTQWLRFMVVLIISPSKKNWKRSKFCIISGRSVSPHSQCSYIINEPP